MTSHLDRLLFIQGGHCFFCQKALPRADASIEHLVASANGGSNDEGNCVACCKQLNQLLGAKSIKEKMQVLLNQRGRFRCPMDVQQAAGASLGPTAQAVPISAAPLPAPPPKAIDLVVADLKKRGASRPRKLATLSSTIKALLKQQHLPNSDSEVEALIQSIQEQGKLQVGASGISYKLG